MSSQHGQTGGAWKVAYADFVTSMMCLFLVLWIQAMSQDVRETIAGYFRSHAILKSLPDGVGFDKPMELLRLLPKSMRPPEPAAGSGKGSESRIAREIAKTDALKHAASVFLRDLQPSANNTDITDTDEYRLEFQNDGFRLNIMDRSRNPIFGEGNAQLTEHGRWVLKTLTWELSRYPFRLEIEGHTRANEAVAEGIANIWDLSAQRALVAYRYFREQKLAAKRFWRVAGCADRKPLQPADPGNERNRRLTIVMRLQPSVDVQNLRQAFNLP